ncbi:MAG: glycosyltransferase [Deltaproteobacteria bacterium]
MNVLLTLASASVTGPAERLLGNGRALVRAGHRAAVGHDTRRPGDFAKAIEAAGLTRLTELSLCREVRLRELARDVPRLRARLRETDLVHAHFSHDHHVALLAAAGRRDRVRIVRAVETEANLRPGLGRGFAYRRSDGFEVATEERAERLARTFRLDPRRIAVLPGAVDTDRFSPSPPGARSALRERLGVAPETPLFGIVARMKPDRRHHELVRAAALVRAELPGLQIAIIGRGEGEPALRAEVTRLGLDASVRFAGYWAGDELVVAYRGLDAAVWLAEGNDGSCRGVLEAMAVGLPIVAGDAGASAELVLDGQTGLLVPPGDVNALAAALGRLARDAAERRAFGEAGRRRVLERYGWARRERGLLDFYERIVALPPVGR